MLRIGISACFDQVCLGGDVAIVRIVNEYTQSHKALRRTYCQQNFIRAKRLRDDALGLVRDNQRRAAGIPDDPWERRVGAFSKWRRNVRALRLHRPAVRP